MPSWMGCRGAASALALITRVAGLTERVVRLYRDEDVRPELSTAELANMIFETYTDKATFNGMPTAIGGNNLVEAVGDMLGWSKIEKYELRPC